MILPASATACSADLKNLDLIFLPDKLSHKTFLADSGASLSIVPHKSNSRTTGPKLKSVNGAAIRAWGFKQFTLLIGQTRFVHRFLLADVANPILGIDFFKKFNLVISPPAHAVLFASTNTDILRDVSCPPQLAATPSVSAAAPLDLDSSVRRLLQDFPGLLAPACSAPCLSHGVEHIIETAGRPIFAKAR